jgi:hypothetical protein
MNLQDMLDEYINFKIQEVLDVALANKEKTVTKELESIRELITEFDNNLDEVRSLADENEYNQERLEERVNSLEDDGVMLNEGVMDARVKKHLDKLKIVLEK